MTGDRASETATDATSSSPEAESSLGDGRHARRDRNRLAVLDAAIALFHEGNLRPRADEVAARSGISLRSLYRYFPDYAALFRAAIERNFERAGMDPTIPDVGEGPLDTRIARLVESRLALFEVLVPSLRLGRFAEQDNEFVRERLATGRELFRVQLERQFAPELSALARAARAAIATSLDALCQLETIYYLREHRGLTSGEASAALTAGLAALLRR